MKNRTRQKKIYLPPNPRLGIVEGFYTVNQFCELLRQAKNSPDTVQYLADMLEE